MAAHLAKPQLDVGLVTNDEAAALKFFRDLLGFEDAGEVVLPGVGLIRRLSCGNSVFRIVVPEKPVEQEAVAGSYDAQTGLRYLTLTVTNLEQLVRQAQDAGYPVPVAPLTTRPGVRVAQISDGRGVTVELMQIDEPA